MNDQTNVKPPLAPVVYGPGEAPALYWSAELHRRELATGEQTAGSFSLTETRADAGYASPFHIHHDDDEAIYVLEGRINLYLGDDVHEGRPGSWFFMPREVPHGYFIRKDGPARMLIFNAPAGFDRFFHDHGQPVEGGPPAAPTLSKEEGEKILLEQYGVEILPPPNGYPTPW
ncbi:MAG: cupin domain-containing protein [Solirubrobacterales bacterium]